MREQIIANQKRLGVVPANAELTPWPKELAKWETLSASEKKLFARQAEVFAGYTAYTDHEIGRVIQQVEDMGKLDNTIIIYIVGDNGTSPEGSTLGHPTFHRLQRRSRCPRGSATQVLRRWGLPLTYPHMAVAWSWAFDTPFKWTKQIASHFGGTRQGLAISWPARIKDAGGIRRQFHHSSTSFRPFLRPRGSKRRVRQRHQAKPIEGVSMAYTFDRAKADAPSTHHTQYFEMVPTGGFTATGWYANTTPPVPAVGTWVRRCQT